MYMYVHKNVNTYTYIDTCTYIYIYAYLFVLHNTQKFIIYTTIYYMYKCTRICTSSYTRSGTDI